MEARAARNGQLHKCFLVCEQYLEVLLYSEHSVIEQVQLCIILDNESFLCKNNKKNLFVFLCTVGCFH